MSILKQAAVPTFLFDSDSVSNRASMKLIDGKIFIGGHSGKDGQCGERGAQGRIGLPGAVGVDGDDGSDGETGSDGTPGEHGQDSDNALVLLYGTVEHPRMQLQTFRQVHSQTAVSAPQWTPASFIRENVYQFDLNEKKGIILIQAIGGNGGNGGDGGRGGNGGRGGDGGTGVKGQPGENASALGERGEDGENGERGGDGGSGGSGGAGGSGGNGGNAGAGGHVQIRSSDARLFMLIDVDCRAGLGGKGGQGGSGGTFGLGGSGGRGGLGGPGGNGGISLTGMRGKIGPRGSKGACGSSGSRGAPGSCGSQVKAGSIQYILVNDNNQPIEINSDKYHASIYSYTITDDNNDGIFEPNSDFFVTNVQWINNGAMHLPPGCILTFRNTQFISLDVQDVSILPDASVNQNMTDSHQFKCHMNDVAVLPINRPYIQSVTLTSEISLLNRVFSGSEVSTTFTCQYPIQITEVKVPTYLGPNERAMIIIDFKNISTCSYGVCANSAGSIKFNLSLHPLLKIVQREENDSYHITSDGCAFYEINEEIPSKSTKQIQFEILLVADAIHQIFDHSFWNVDLLLSEKVIERRQEHIRIVPTFQPHIHTDVLLVTNSRVDRAEYLVYQNLFGLFKYSSQTWDMERYDTFHHPEIKWLNTADLIIFIRSNSESSLDKIKSQTFLQHMHSSNHAGFIFIGNIESDDFDFALFNYHDLQYKDFKEQSKCEAKNHVWSGIGFRQPSLDNLIEEGNKIRLEFERRDDHKYLYQLVYDNTMITSERSCMNITYGHKYVYKSTLDLQVGARLIVIPSADPLLTYGQYPVSVENQLNSQLHNDVVPSSNQNNRDHTVHKSWKSSKIVQREIYLESNFGRLLCALLFYQGFEKSHLITSENRELVNYTFRLGQRKYSFDEILVSLAMSIIEVEYNRGTLKFPLSKQLIDQVADALQKESRIVDNRLGKQGAWLYVLIQSLSEYSDSKNWKSLSWCTSKHIGKQRILLLDLLNQLKSLFGGRIIRNEDIDTHTRNLRLHKLANIKFPAADKRNISVRSVVEIQGWKVEQKPKKKTLPSH